MAFWDPEIELELDEGERLLMACRHHWTLLARESAIPLAVMLVAGGAALYRAIGGGFFGTDREMARQLDGVNIALLALLVFLGVLWARGADQPKKKAAGGKPGGGGHGGGGGGGHGGNWLASFFSLTWALPIGMALLALLVWYRYEGGRLLTIAPERATPFDIPNLVLIGIAAFALLALLYIAVDWRDDTLVLTNTRIILDKDEFLVRHIQQQILLADVQQVSLRQTTYPQVIFGYGSITVQSYSLKKINFDFATRPQEMERRIKDELTRARKQIEPNLMRRLIAERVFEDKKPAAAAPHKKFHVETKGANRQGILAWLFPANPEIDERSGQITWRPSSVYIGLKLLRPFAIWLAVTLVLAFVAGQLGPWLVTAALGWLLLTLAVGAWIFWLREEYVNDVYILNRREIIDVDRRPFGPVNRRSAPIDRIQNISFDIKFVEQLLGFGTVRIQTGGSGDFSFNHVPDPRGVQATINDYLTDFKKTSDERALQNSVEVFREYHALQREKGELMDRPSIDRAMDDKARTAVDSYASEVAPIQIALQVRQALRAQARAERRERVRRLMLRRRDAGDEPADGSSAP